jgi:REP element-mobilizing transposase RayT
MPAIMIPHFAALTAAYQLHFYFCFKTRYLRPFLEKREQGLLVDEVLQDVCTREDYHLLESDISQDQLRLLLSLKPAHSVSRVANMLKGNTSRQFGMNCPDILKSQGSKTLWSRGYFAQTSGKVNLETARAYVESQVTHHEYRGQWTDALNFCNSNFSSPVFPIAHSVCMLNYHIVLATHQRLPIFDETIAPNLFRYVMAIGAKHGFAVDRMGVLPDQIHLIIEARPDVSVEDCVRAALENTRYWMTKNYYGVLKEAKGFDVWQPTFYAGSVGDYSTAQVKRFLSGC